MGSSTIYNPWNSLTKWLAPPPENLDSLSVERDANFASNDFSLRTSPYTLFEDSIQPWLTFCYSAAIAIASGIGIHKLQTVQKFMPKLKTVSLFLFAFATASFVIMYGALKELAVQKNQVIRLKKPLTPDPLNKLGETSS